MTPPRALFSPEALAQLTELENYLLEHTSSGVADAYMDRLLEFCDRLGARELLLYRPQHQ